MTAKPTRAAVMAWTRLMRSEQAVRGRVEDDLKRAGLPPLAWYDVLLELDTAPEGWLRQSDVQSRTLFTQYNLCRLVDRLEREKLVERRQCTRDGRNNVLVITDKGRALRARMWPAYGSAIQAHVGSRITAPEAEVLAGLLDKLAARPEPGK
ncbi:MAG: MarR family winged helix-turn-helix transcriptional regulator [Hyphomicrobiaceae bacterium]